jgi:hypothetical protein
MFELTLLQIMSVIFGMLGGLICSSIMISALRQYYGRRCEYKLYCKNVDDFKSDLLNIMNDIDDIKAHLKNNNPIIDSII